MSGVIVNGGALMKAVRFHEYGPPEVLTVESVEMPPPEAGQLLVRVRAAGVHPFDWKLRNGYLKEYVPVTLPHTGGLDFSGVVETVGAGAPGFREGDHVYGRGSATYAEYAVADFDAVALKPRSVTFEEAAAVPIGAGTAWTALFDAAHLQSGQRVLIHGGAGGVGAYAVQLAKWKGVFVIATTSTPNVEFVQSLGADKTIDYTTTKFEDVAEDMDAVIDTVGGDLIETSWSVLKPGGIFVTIAGQPSQEEAAKRGVRAMSAQGTSDTKRLQELARLIDEGRLRPALGQVFPMNEAAAAQRLSESGHGRGRIVLRIPG